MHKADKFAEECNTSGIERINYLGMALLFVFYFVVTFLPISLGAEAAKEIVELLPEWLIAGFGVAGGLMPAIGFAMLLNIMFKKKGLVKEGKVAVVFDANEMHPFQYDVYESGSLPLKKGKIKIEEKKSGSCLRFCF